MILIYIQDVLYKNLLVGAHLFFVFTGDSRWLLTDWAEVARLETLIWIFNRSPFNVLTKTSENKLGVAQIAMERVMLRITLKDKSMDPTTEKSRWYRAKNSISKLDLGQDIFQEGRKDIELKEDHELEIT